MDLSILAAAGSFVVSERLLGPKAYVLIGLGILLCYDLITKTYDPAGRVYRGPGLIAATLMCSAFCLRQWRRNGIACDELLFLPDTVYAKKHAASSTLQHFIKRSESQSKIAGFNVKNDVEAGVIEMRVVAQTKTTSDFSGDTTKCGEVGGVVLLDKDENILLDDDKGGDIMTQSPLEHCNGQHNDTSTTSPLTNREPENDSDDANNPEKLLDPLLDSLTDDKSENDENPAESKSIAESWESDSDDDHFAYAPSGAAVFGASLDLLLPVFFNFHLFTLATNFGNSGNVSPRLFPFFFFNVIIFRSIFPRDKRRRFWGVMKYTIMAPFHKVGFRDEVVGDVLTSMIRPTQDLVFAFFYYITCIRIVFTSKKMSEAITILEQSWTLHNLILPIFAMCPLWWKFLQTLRLWYDTKRRYPHMLNAFKYLSAALIISYGMAHPENRRSRWWIFALILATIYQILCDVIIDWELFVIIPSASHEIPKSEGCVISSMSRSTCWSVYRIIVRPILNLFWFLQQYCGIPSGYTIGLRAARQFRNDKYYLGIFWFNVVFRFCWMLSFIPAYYLSPNGEIQRTFSSELNSYIGIFIAIAEIGRRGLWAILKVELESIKLTDPNYGTDGVNDAKGMTCHRNCWKSCCFRTKLETRYESVPTSSMLHAGNHNSSLPATPEIRISKCANRLLLFELLLWTGAFISLGWIMYTY